MKLTGEDRTTRGKTCPSATLSTTNPTWTDPGSNPGLRGGRPATIRLKRGTTITPSYEFTLLLNLRSLILSLTPFGWLRIRMLSGAYETHGAEHKLSMRAHCKVRQSPCARRLVQTT
jgi:hypothetical protein